MEKYKKLDELLSWLERHIDEAHVARVRERCHRAICFEKVDRVPLHVWVRQGGGFEPVPREQTFENPELMLYNELVFSFGSPCGSVLIGDDSLYQVRSNRGVIIIPSLFGAEASVVNGMPWSKHLSEEALNRALAHGVPDLEAGLGARVMEDHEYFRARLAGYPKCARTIHITQPDLQGPFDNAHLLMGNELFYQTYDDPGRVHELLSLVTETAIAFAKRVEPQLSGTLFGDSIVVHGSLYGGHMLIKDDTAAINLSEAFYEAFAGRYNHRIMEAMDGASLHHCGTFRDWHFRKFEHPLLRGINYGQPQMHNFQDKLRNAEGARVPIIGWGHDLPYDGKPLREFRAEAPATGITLSCLVETVDEGKRAFDAYLEWSERPQQPE